MEEEDSDDGSVDGKDSGGHTLGDKALLGFIFLVFISLFLGLGLSMGLANRGQLSTSAAGSFNSAATAPPSMGPPEEVLVFMSAADPSASPPENRPMGGGKPRTPTSTTRTSSTTRWRTTRTSITTRWRTTQRHPRQSRPGPRRSCLCDPRKSQPGPPPRETTAHATKRGRRSAAATPTRTIPLSAALAIGARRTPGFARLTQDRSVRGANACADQNRRRGGAATGRHRPLKPRHKKGM